MKCMKRTGMIGWCEGTKSERDEGKRNGPSCAQAWTPPVHSSQLIDDHEHTGTVVCLPLTRPEDSTTDLIGYMTV